MKITNKQLKQIIKEELSKVLNEGNDLIDHHGYNNYLQGPRYIKGDINSPLDGPWNQAELLKQTLRAVTQGYASPSDVRRGMRALNNLKMHVEQGHPDIPTRENSLRDLVEFLEWAETKLQGV